MADQKTLMERVFKRAEEMGLEQDLARLSGIGNIRMEAIRSGETVSSSEFELICRALAVDSGAMYMGHASSPARSPARFRAATAIKDPSPTDVRLLALAAEQGRILGHLVNLLGKEVKLQNLRRVVGIRGRDDLWREGYDFGEAARMALSPDKCPLFNLTDLMNKAGVHIARISLSSEYIDAASIWEPYAVPIVIVNTRSHVFSHPGAFHASLAHEMCHLLHDAGERNLTTNVSWGAEGKGNYQDDLEVRARAFAPAFIAPRDWIRDWYDTLATSLKRDTTGMIKALAETWGFSFEGATWHAKNCGLIESVDADRLAKMPKKPMISLEEFEPKEDTYPPAMVDSELPENAAPLWEGWASLLVLEALQEGHISIGRARELLSWS